MTARRDFMLGVAGLMFPVRLVHGGLISIANGKSGSDGGAPTPAPSGDFVKRASMPGVVWAHNFESANEANYFRDSGSVGVDPTGIGNPTVSWISGDGFDGGGCVECLIPSGTTGEGSWSRPMGALNAGGNGLAANDPAANGTVIRRAWDPNTPSSAYNKRNGYYAHPAIQATYPQWPSGTSNVYDGTEFWLQFRVKISASRYTAGNPNGKLVFLDVTAGLSNEQEIVIRSVNKSNNNTSTTFAATMPWLAYTSRGDDANSILAPTQGSYSGSISPGGPYEATCTYGGTKSNGDCFEFPADEWTTVLVHVIPGRDNRDYVGMALSAWPYNDHVIEAWVQRSGEAFYTKVFEHFGLKWYYYSSPQSSGNGPNGEWHAPGFNKVSFSTYMNGVPSVAGGGWTQRYAQPIFSKDYIPPVGETAPAWWTAAVDGEWTAIAAGAGQQIDDVLPSPTPSTGLSGEGPAAICTAWVGGSVDQRRGEYLFVANGGHADYPGNEAYALALRAATPAWRRLTDPTPNAQMPSSPPIFDEGGGLYNDNRPRAMHNTFQCYGDGRVWMPAMNSVTSGGGGFINRQISFNRDAIGDALTTAPYSTNPWTDYGQLSGVNGTIANFGVGCFHRYRHRAYGFAGNSANNTQWWWLNTLPNQNSGDALGAGHVFNSGQSFGHFGTWVVCAHDLDIIVLGDHLRNVIVVLDCATNTMTQISNVTGTGYFASHAGGVYLAKHRQIAIGDPVKIGSGRIYKLVIPTKTVSGRTVYDDAGQWVWSAIDPGGATILTRGTTGAYGKWNLVEDMGDGRSAIVGCFGIDRPTYVYKVPVTGLP